MPAVQKKYKPIWVDEPLQDYYNLVTPSDDFCFLLELLQGLLFLHPGEGQKINKMPANNVARIQKDKIGGKKLQKAMREYDEWHQKLTEIWKNKNCHLGNDIKLFCRQLDNSNKKRNWKIMVKTP